MSDPDRTALTREKILAMLAAGRVSPEEADELLSAAQGRPRPWRRWLNPFAWASAPQLWGLAGATAAASIACAPFGIAFDGALDMHLVSAPHPWRRAWIEALVAWPWLASCLWLATRIPPRRGRWRDMLAMVGAARLPLLIAGVLTRLLIGEPPTADPDPGQHHLLLVAMLVAVPLSVVFIAGLWQAFRTVGGGQRPYATLSFTAALIIAETSSKLLLWVL
ncbi:MAG: hypothetical protein B7733_02415 [Myxococcales bacterium FL481]|nr:MAG: hypothetical protein B7733_02415 [Myxococcales bacterium FL481]